MWICSGQNGIGKGFSLSILGLPYQYHSASAPDATLYVNVTRRTNWRILETLAKAMFFFFSEMRWIGSTVTYV
jgi:hypothetical protein